MQLKVGVQSIHILMDYAYMVFPGQIKVPGIAARPLDLCKFYYAIFIRQKFILQAYAILEPVDKISQAACVTQYLTCILQVVANHKYGLKMHKQNQHSVKPFLSFSFQSSTR